jgi:hypothetical protein
VGFDASDARILPDMGVKVAFREQASASPDQQRGVLVPAAALRRQGETDYVLVVAGAVLERRAVTLAGSRGKDMLISGGLSGGEVVVVGGAADLAEGTRVEEMN